jgi:hypothetical protein
VLVWNIFGSAAKKIQGNIPAMNAPMNDFLYLAYFWVLGSVSYQAKDIQWK